MQVKLWKNYKILFLIIFGFLCFFININTANAYVFKQELWNTMDRYTSTATLTTGNTSTSMFHITQPNNLNTPNYPYDLVVFKFNKLAFKTTESYNISGDLKEWECSKWTQSGTTYTCSTMSVYGGNTNNLNVVNINSGNIYIQARLIYTASNSATQCFLSDDMKDMILCPMTHYSGYQVDGIEINIQNGGYDSLIIDYELSGLKFGYNYDTTEVVNALENQSTTTIQNLQVIQQQNTQQQQYLENQNLTGTETQVSTDITSTSTDLTTASNSVNDLTNIIMLPLTLFMDLSTSTCTPIRLTVPFVNTTFDLPCMSGIYNTYFNTFLTIFSTVICTITCYWISIKSFRLIKELLDCDNDRIEVLDL